MQDWICIIIGGGTCTQMQHMLGNTKANKY